MRQTGAQSDMKLPLPTHISVASITAEGSGTLVEQSIQWNECFRTAKWFFLFTGLGFLLGVLVGVFVPSLSPSSTTPVDVPSSGSSTVPVFLQTTFLPRRRDREMVRSSTNFTSRNNQVGHSIGAREEKGWSKLELSHDQTNRVVSPRMAAVDVNSKQGRDDKHKRLVPNPVSFIEPEGKQKPNASEDVTEDLFDGHVAATPRPNVTSGHSGEAVRGVYWSPSVEELLPTGFGDEDAKDWREFCQKSLVVRVDEGCGRMQNRLVVFQNGTRSCCRYRQNYDQIQGEIFTFYLSRLLGLRNLPPSALGLVRRRDPQWANVQSSLNLAQWTEDRPVVYTKYLDGLEPAFIPTQLRASNRHLTPEDVRLYRLRVRPERNEVVTLAQWSDLVVLDYLTGNLDRIVNNMYNMQWNPAMMDSPAHNLARDPQSGLLVFLDNESSLLHGYRLLEKYEVYHKSLLDAVCIFRLNTIQALRQLQVKRNVGFSLRRMFESHHLLLVDYLPFLPEKSIKMLNQRIDSVLEHVEKCETIFGA